ncbi:GPI ethanolamine phosphate transferase 1 [Endocarpon pusillum Z07020]|uniref:GPI ethanolamine phosphate transferase 1 n=1 Tax=Endocarpon pusillum (strain Z07020 / HMAS-L-300199) TaxID=1263415 RepID=U1HKU5_ENDPU|nr:GPI ethanolamine phosphate transferase 1 [Endocarpon pusillum Z07020]ERF69579.1 GPI ethanolamine phosphate transferase 1 [Endocarpon pusillum Z07020]
MAKLGRGGFLAIAVIFHLVYLFSIFDIYFVSPVVSGMRAYKVERSQGTQAPAKRLVLFVGDGLRADKAFQSFPDPSPAGLDTDSTPKPLAPFLRSRVLSHGTFGVSHTRVPTESRPGHVALIAGLYEDVSAVTTGWKLNPVNFDSVFNRSSHTWSWGSPDILPMFKEGAVPGRIDADMYGEEAEDYTQDATQLDTWVFEKVKSLFASAKLNSTLDSALREEKTVFFLHLLGLDTTGHSYRPYSKEYLHNIKVVDQGVKEITELIEEFYSDGKTAFVFTADHGMSDWGSHGDGHPDNTRTPLIAWGSGVARPKKWESGKAQGHEDGFSADWGLDLVQRHDVAQADVAALMSYLIGLEFPVNSVGELPLTYLAGDIEEKAEAALANAQAVLEMYRVKELHKQATAFHYQPYSAFSTEEDSIYNRTRAIRSMIDSGQFEEAIRQSSEVLQHALQGLRYLQTYNWLFLRALVTLGYLGWIVYALTTVIDLHVLHSTSHTKRTSVSNSAFTSLLIILYSSLFLQKSPWTYYAYGVFPVYFWEEVFARRSALTAGCKTIFRHISGFRGQALFAFQSVAFVAILEALVQSYFHRIIFTVCYILGAIWPVFYGTQFFKENKLLVISWMVNCLMLSTFTVLPVVKVESSATISAGGILMAGTGILYMLFERSIISVSLARGGTTASHDLVSRSVMGIQVGLILLAIIVTRSSIASLQAKKGLPLGNQIVGWFTLIASFGLPFVHRFRPNKHYLHRLVVIFLTFSPSFVILTISYEGLFYFAFCTTLITWIRLENRIYAFSNPKPSSPTTSTNRTTTTDALSTKTLPQYRPLTLSDLRISLFFFYLLQSAFFSTGNIASISSFSLDAVYRLIPIFDPFSQGALLLLKILIPFAVLSANLGILNLRLGLEPSALFMLVMAVSDVMTLNFFWMVRDEGSWLDIGTSISHFVIGSLLNVFVAGLEGLSGWVIGGTEERSEGREVDALSMEKGVGHTAHTAPAEIMAAGAVAANGSPS